MQRMQKTTPLATRRQDGVVTKCLNMDPVLARELAVAAARDRRSQVSIVEELLVTWLDERKRRDDPAQTKLEVGP